MNAGLHVRAGPIKCHGRGKRTLKSALCDVYKRLEGSGLYSYVYFLNHPLKQAGRLLNRETPPSKINFTYRISFLLFNTRNVVDYSFLSIDCCSFSGCCSIDIQSCQICRYSTALLSIIPLDSVTHILIAVGSSITRLLSLQVCRPSAELNRVLYTSQ